MQDQPPDPRSQAQPSNMFVNHQNLIFNKIRIHLRNIARTVGGPTIIQAFNKLINSIRHSHHPNYSTVNQTNIKICDFWCWVVQG